MAEEWVPLEKSEDVIKVRLKMRAYATSRVGNTTKE